MKGGLDTIAAAKGQPVPSALRHRLSQFERGHEGANEASGDSCAASGRRELGRKGRENWLTP